MTYKYELTKTAIGLNYWVALPEGVTAEQAEELHATNGWTIEQAIAHWGNPTLLIRDSNYPQYSEGEDSNEPIASDLPEWFSLWSDEEFGVEVPTTPYFCYSQLVTFDLYEYENGTTVLNHSYKQDNFDYNYSNGA